MLSVKEGAVMRVLFKLSGWVGKAYCYPSQKKIVKLCVKWCGVRMSRRTLCRVTGRLDSGSFVRRVRRHHRGPDGGMIFKSTLYVLQGRAFNWAASLGRFSNKVFSVFRVPKLAQYQSTSAIHLKACGRMQPLIAAILQKGSPSGP